LPMVSKTLGLFVVIGLFINHNLRKINMPYLI
jgi:hypothetical protein